jgi:hypothetical protein
VSFIFCFVKKEKGKEIYKSNGKYKQSSLKEKRSVRSAGTNPTLRDIVGCVSLSFCLVCLFSIG